MQYQGGKWRMRKEISNILQDFYKENPSKFKLYIEPFVGGGSVLSEICNWWTKPIIASDYNEDLIIMWKALKDGWIPPENFKVDEDYYYSLFKQPSSALRTLILFSCSFGGGFMGTFARSDEAHKHRNYYNSGRNGLMQKWSSIQNTNCQFVFSFYAEYDSHVNSLMYLDPPYRNTHGYKGVKEKFDHNKFDNWCREMSKTNFVMISEYEMPSDFECIYEKEKPNSLQAQLGKIEIKVEKLFVHPESFNYLYK